MSRPVTLSLLAIVVAVAVAFLNGGTVYADHCIWRAGVPTSTPVPGYPSEAQGNHCEYFAQDQRLQQPQPTPDATKENWTSYAWAIEGRALDWAVSTPQPTVTGTPRPTGTLVALVRTAVPKWTTPIPYLAWNEVATNEDIAFVSANTNWLSG